MNTMDLDKAYVSPYDKFFFEFNATHKKSKSQVEEIQKHAKLAKMRDDKEHAENQGAIWEEF